MRMGLRVVVMNRSSSLSKITRHFFEQEMIGKQRRRGYAKHLRCPRQAHSTLPILRQVVSLARAYPPSPNGLSAPLDSAHRASCLFRRLGFSVETDWHRTRPLFRFGEPANG